MSKWFTTKKVAKWWVLGYSIYGTGKGAQIGIRNADYKKSKPGVAIDITTSTLCGTVTGALFSILVPMLAVSHLANVARYPMMGPVEREYQRNRWKDDIDFALMKF
jgi:hypothetical protein